MLAPQKYSKVCVAVRLVCLPRAAAEEDGMINIKFATDELKEEARCPFGF